MHAAVLTAFNQPLEIQNVDSPACPPDGVVVAIKACGVCRSDWHGWKGAHPAIKLPHIPGHELAGIIEEVGPECKNFRVGQRVTAPFILSCGTCPDCASGKAIACGHQHVIGFGNPGAFAEYLAVPRADFNLVPLPDAFSFVDAAGMGCRVTTAFRALVDRANIQPGEWLAVHGCGGVGLSAILIAKALGARIVAVDVNEDALTYAKKLGAEHTINANQVENVGESVRELTGGGANVSVEALGITTTFNNSIMGLAKLGRHIQVGLPVDTNAHVDLPLLDIVYMRQISLMGMRGMSASGFPDLFSLITEKNLNPGQLIAGTIPLSEASNIFLGMDNYAGSGITVIDRF